MGKLKSLRGMCKRHALEDSNMAFWPSSMTLRQPVSHCGGYMYISLNLTTFRPNFSTHTCGACTRIWSLRPKIHQRVS